MQKRIIYVSRKGAILCNPTTPRHDLWRGLTFLRNITKAEWGAILRQGVLTFSAKSDIIISSFKFNKKTKNVRTVIYKYRN